MTSPEATGQRDRKSIKHTVFRSTTTRCPIQSRSSRAKAKVDGPKDLPTKVEIGKHRYKPRKKGMREGMDPSPGNKKSDMNYRPFCNNGHHDRAYGRWDDPRGAVWPNKLSHRCCSAGIGRSHTPFAGEGARPLAVGRREPRWAQCIARALREFTMLNSLTEQSGMSQRVGAQRVLESPLREQIGGEASRGDDVTERTL